jgi:hypothetical protein
MKAKSDKLMHGSFYLNNRKQIRFWEDKWLGNYTFKQQYPSLYNIVWRKSDTIEKFLSTVTLNISFRRFLTEKNIRLWNNLVQRIMPVQSKDQEDVFI